MECHPFAVARGMFLLGSPANASVQSCYRSQLCIWLALPITTEYSRVESAIADRQKGDFISSISHELRSPLHGVLAAAEPFGATGLNEFQESP